MSTDSFIVGFADQTPHDGADAEKVEVVAGHQTGAAEGCAIPEGQVHADDTGTGQAGERVCCFCRSRNIG